MLPALAAAGWLLCFDASSGSFRAPGHAVGAPPKPPAPEVQKSPRRFRPAPRVIIVYPYGFYPYRFYHGPHLHPGHGFFDPDLHPFFCWFHGAAFISRAGFLDHVAGTHKVPLDRALTLCAEDGSSCFFGY